MEQIVDEAARGREDRLETGQAGRGVLTLHGCDIARAERAVSNAGDCPAVVPEEMDAGGVDAESHGVARAHRRHAVELAVASK